MGNYELIMCVLHELLVIEFYWKYNFNFFGI